MDNQDRGLVNKWLRNIKEVYAKNQDELKKIQDFNERANRLVELNVIQQVQNLAQTSIIQKAWKKRKVQIHGWIYDMRDGHIKDLNCMMAELNDLDPIFRYDID
jgi:carbonic anhydrase